ncbi:MAG: nuclear transport factor 2 family protein [Thermoanaerobaculia bacterium]
MDESDRALRAATEMAGAIERRDVEALERALAPGFLHRTPGGETRDAETFLQGILEIPGEIVFGKLLCVAVDLSESGAMVTGIQHARVRVGGVEIDDRRAFVDRFATLDGSWRIRVAVDVPLAEETPLEATR